MGTARGSLSELIKLPMIVVRRETDDRQNDVDQKAGDGQGDTGDGQAKALIKFGMPVDLDQRDDGKDATEDVERHAVAATKHPGNEAQNKADGGKVVGFPDGA